jgi:membrane protein implicated in regulation of membrane protease activity
MTMKPGCGCLLLLLAIGNLVLLISSIAAAVRGNLTVLTGIAMAVLFAANVVAAGMLGLAAMRGVSFGQKSAVQDADEPAVDESTSVTEEGTDESAD